MIQAGSTKHRREPEDQRNKRNIERERRGKEKTQTRKEEQKRDSQDVQHNLSRASLNRPCPHFWLFQDKS
jgi:hypothetical protein